MALPRTARWIGVIVLVCAMVTACADPASMSAAEHEWEATIAPGSFAKLFSDSDTLFAAGATETGAPALWASRDASTWRLVYADPQRIGSMSFVASGKSGSVALGHLRGEGAAFWYASSDSKWKLARQVDDVLFHSLVTVRDGYFAVGSSKVGLPTAYRSADGREWSPRR